MRTHSIRQNLISVIIFWSILAILSAETEQKTLPAAPPTKLDKPSWERVLSGMTVAQPKKTSYGFLQMLDGRILVACASDGKVLWQQPLNGKPGSFITVDSINDFCYALVNENKKLQLYNPSGIWLWTATLPEPAIFEPLPGRDGRIFVQGAEHILCYGINGKLKWSTQVSRTGGFPLYELPDGSLLYIQEKKLRGKSTALRISPYGSILEELTFSGVVSSAGQTKQGVILVFSDGAVGCCSVKDGMAYSQWIRSGVITKPDSCTVLETASVCTLIAASSGGSQAVLINPGTGETIAEIPALGPSAQAIEFTDYTAGIVTVADGATAAGININTKQVEWRAVLPAHDTWKYLITMEPGTLILTGSASWKISSYRIRQYPKSTTSAQTAVSQRGSYAAFIQEEVKENQAYNYIPLNTYDLAEITKTLQKGEYGKKEFTCYLDIRQEADRLKDRYYQPATKLEGENMFPSYHLNLRQAEQLFAVFPLFGTDSFVKDIAYAIRNEADQTLLASAVSAAAQTGYDPRGDMIAAIGIRMRNSSVLQNPALIARMCNAVYEICRFMGKPAFITQGKEQLFFLMNPSFSEKIRASAEHTLKKLIDLQIQ